MSHPPGIERLLGQPLLIEPRRLQAIVSSYRPGENRAFSFDDPEDEEVVDRPYEVSNGVAILNIHGALEHRQTLLGWFLGRVNYEYLSRIFAQAVEDEGVSAILLSVDSPGGLVAGCFDLVDEIYAARGVKPIVAVANDMADSAAYAIASAADDVVVTRTGVVGSIGVVCLHIDQSRALNDFGLTVTPIYAGEHKIDGASFRPLTDDAKNAFQADVDRIYSLFVATVARNRGMTDEAVRATEAATYMGEAAITAGLADRIGNLSGVLAELGASPDPVEPEGAFRADSAQAQRMERMTTASKPAGGPSGEENTPETSDIALQLNAARQESQTAERARIHAILGSEEAQGRDDLAQHLAFGTDMTADAAKALLAKAEKKAPPVQQNAGTDFAAAMREAGNPNVGADAGATDPDDPVALANQIIASFHAVTGTNARN